MYLLFESNQSKTISVNAPALQHQVEIKQTSSNNNSQEHLNRVSTSSNDTEEIQSHGFIEFNYTLNSFNLKRKQLSSSIHQYEPAMPLTLQHEQSIWRRFEHEQNFSSIAERGHVSLSTFQPQQSSLSQSQHHHPPSIIAEDEQILSPISEDEPFLSIAPQTEQITSSQSNNIFSSTYQ